MKTDKDSLKTIEEIIPKLKEIDPEKNIDDYTYEELMLVMKFMHCHELYNKRFVETAHIECQFKSVEFYDYLRKDVYFNEEIMRYNICHKSEIDFWTYVMNFHEAALYNILYSRTNYHTLETPPEDDVYTFTFYFVKVGAPDIFDYVCDRIPEIRTDYKDDVQPETLDDKFFGDDKEYFDKMKQFIETVKKEKKERQMSKRRKGKKIEKYDTDGNLICTYKDRQDCMKHEGMSKQCLSNVLTGKRKTYKGYIYNEID